MGHIFKAAMAAALTGLIALPASPSLAAERLIGTATYEVRPQRDVIEVGGREGAYQAFRFEVRGSDVEILDLKVVYGNGNAEDIRVRQLFKAGSSSRVIDLAGRQRAIRQIIVTYLPRGPARIQFYGIEGKPIQDNWERLGCQSVGFGIDRDVIKVGRREGAFRAIRLKVRNAPIEIYDLRVIFGNGTSQSFRVRTAVPAGAETRPIDLDGKSRGIDRVEVIYRSIPNFKGKAEVCLDGLQR